MALTSRTVPREFVDKLPEGMQLVHQNGSEYLVVEELFCPNGHSLMFDDVRIHDQPSIRIAVERPEGTGLAFIDAYWGSHSKLFTFLPDEIRRLERPEIYCPHCGVSLLVDRRCRNPSCGSTQSLKLTLPGENNAIYVCARLGCPDHEIAVHELSSRASRAVSGINFPSYSAEDEEFGSL